MIECTYIKMSTLRIGALAENIGGSTMAYYITDNCAKCGTCADACPLGIITEGDGKYVIDADQCVECGSCAAACPMEAIEQQ